MPVDLRLNLGTKDLVIDGHNDLALIDGNGLVNQRIFTRISIPRGSFLYDRDGSLGSALQTALNLSDPAARKDAAAKLIYDALQPMDDIIIINVSVVEISITNSSKLSLQASVQWLPSSASQEPTQDLSNAVSTLITI